MKRYWNNSALSLIEVAFASVVVTISAIAVARTASMYLSSLQRERNRAAVFQVENVIKKNIYNATSQFFFELANAGCNLSSVPFSAALNGTTGSGMSYEVYEGSPALVSEDGTIFARPTQRCANSVGTNPPDDYFDTRAGIYFCLTITPSSTTSNEVTRNLERLQPILGEFFFTTISYYPGEEGETLCSARAGSSGGLLGLMHYTLYYVNEEGERKHFDRVKGLVTQATG